MRSSEEFLLPLRWDVEGRGSNDWLLAVVTSTAQGGKLSAGTTLHVRVLDRFGRPRVAQTVSRQLQALIGGVGARIEEDVQALWASNAVHKGIGLSVCVHACPHACMCCMHLSLSLSL